LSLIGGRACVSCRVRREARLLRGQGRQGRAGRRRDGKGDGGEDYCGATTRQRQGVQKGAVVIRRIVQREREAKGGGEQEGSRVEEEGEAWARDGVVREGKGDLHGQPRAGDAHL
jgi:hypothetical protein